MLIDTGPGISANVLYFTMAAQEIIMVTCPEPMAIASACAFMKVLACEHGHRKFQLLVNAVTTAYEGDSMPDVTAHHQQSLDIEFTPLDGFRMTHMSSKPSAGRDPS
jgi:MinD-like ATPase involved in chromosome partitioning or flagellar assembly